MPEANGGVGLTELKGSFTALVKYCYCDFWPRLVLLGLSILTITEKKLYFNAQLTAILRCYTLKTAKKNIY